ncbi:MAG: ABC transporter substrate-binding protein [Thermodesulfobacteriota bacterium]|nr:ABC transporter substrate-binding protein [Thermodesulfobacteriota bacterium]
MKKLFLTLFMIVTFASSSFAATLSLGVASDAFTLDPYAFNETATNSILSNIFDTLIRFDADYNIVPGLATSWKALDDKTWEIKLRQGVTFHNGNTFNADDVLFSFERIKTWGKSGFKGKVSAIERVEKIDDFTVLFHTKGPYPLFPRKMTYMKVMDQDFYADKTPEFIGTHPMGTGPYAFVKWIKGATLTLKANTKYWAGVPSYEKATFKVLSNDSTRVAAILSNEVDLINRVPVKDVNRVKSSKNFIMKPGLRLIYLQMDHPRANSPHVKGEINPFADVRVRRAIYYAINEDNIVKYIMNGFAQPAGQFQPKAVFGYDDSIKRVDFDPAKAKQLLAEAGYPNGFEVALDTPNDRYINDDQIALAVASDLAKVKIKVTVNAMPKASFFPKVNSSPPDSSFNLIGWANSDGDASSYLDACVHTTDKEKGYGRYNGGRYSNPEVDRLIEESDVMIDQVKRLELMKKAQKIALHEDQNIIPLHYQVDLYAFNDKITFKPRIDSHLYIFEMSPK